MRYVAFTSMVIGGFLLGRVSDRPSLANTQNRPELKYEWTFQSPRALILPGCECEKCKTVTRQRTLVVGHVVGTRDGKDVSGIVATEFRGDYVPAALLNPVNVANDAAGIVTVVCRPEEFAKRLKEFKEKTN